MTSFMYLFRFGNHHITYALKGRDERTQLDFLRCSSSQPIPKNIKENIIKDQPFNCQLKNIKQYGDATK